MILDNRNNPNPSPAPTVPPGPPPTQTPKAADDYFSRFRPSVMATDPQRMLLIAALISLLLHGAVVVGTYHQPLGRVDAIRLLTASEPVRIKRATYDHFIDVPSPGQREDPTASMTPQDISELLLTQEKPPLPEMAFDVELEMRPVTEALPPQPLADMAVDLPPFELPQEVVETMTSRRPRDMGYTERSGFDVDSAAGVGTGDGGGATQARQLLTDLGVTAGGNPEPIVLDQPLPQTQPRFDDRLLDIPVDIDPIDMAGVALEHTTQLEIPDHLDHDFDYIVRRYETSGEDGYFSVEIIPQRSLTKLRTMPKDVIFLIDISASVPQRWVNSITSGVEAGLRSLNPGDRFNIVLFSEQPDFFSLRGMRSVTPENIQEAVAFLRAARSGGSTDINAALSQLLMRDLEVERVYNLVLISDGIPTRGVVGTRDLINLITRDNDEMASIYCIGVGEQINRELLEFMAYRNKGYCVFAERAADVPNTVREMMSQLRFPLITDVRVNVVGIDDEHIYPLRLRNIHHNERFFVYGRYDQARPFTMRITGHSGGRQVDFTFSRDLRQAEHGNRDIRHNWAFNKLHHLYSEMIRHGEQEQLRQQIQSLRERYGLKTVY